jgi:Arc/MetJ family transcription regulator
MRTNIEIDDKLMKETMKATGAKTKREAVEIAMQTTVRLQQQEKALRALWGIGGWEGDLKKSRTKDKWADAERRAAAPARSTRKKAA